jgi:tRNA(Ile)-lysidine synthase
MGFSRLELEVRGALARAPAPVVLAVSGGVDSMVLMHAAARLAPDRVALVATFDHGTGVHARAAARLVVKQACKLGFSTVRGRAETGSSGEELWRTARWMFLRRVAQGRVVATAHTSDDQVETVLMRAMRGSSARGLAGLHVAHNIARPLLRVGRAAILRYADRNAIEWIEDPFNASLDYFRNRVRLELLPALRSVDPGMDEALLAVGAEAARWRADVDGLLGTIVDTSSAAGSFSVLPFSCLSESGIRMVAPALAARAGAILDRNGVMRLANLIAGKRSRARIQLSGGFEAERTGDIVRFSRRGIAEQPEPASLNGNTRWGRWLFRAAAAPDTGRSGPVDPWRAWLPHAAQLTVRAWRDGDRMIASGSSRPRRVKRFLSDAGIAGTRRIGWPVVVLRNTIVWIPGVRRSAETEPGRSSPETRGYVAYVSERDES